MLPFEDQARQEVEAGCPRELAESRELLQFALDMIGSDGQGGLNIPLVPVPDVTDRARSLALGLYAKACKQFRGIIILGERGFGGEVTVLTRALFETTLAINFIMNETVALKRDGKAFDPEPSTPLTTDFRALLYGAHTAFVQAKRLKQWSERPELRWSMHLRGDQTEIAAQTAKAKCAVGEKWWDALKGGQAGLSVRNLADSLGVFSYYLVIYGDQSEVAHAGDGFMHFELDDDGGSLDLSPSPASIGGLLRLAGLVFLGCLTGIHNRLNFGPEVESALNAFAKRFNVPDGKS
ncbi:hypothetical protein AYO44_12340 [Planctomycetaceae bacterium SCGC AG-212-F19]|nr:hypothetical protein AYO44_12340 [Planctomycetaceae bacterium SCGC AG-212-F19]